jgi:hypothetical protein
MRRNDNDEVCVLRERRPQLETPPAHDRRRGGVGSASRKLRTPDGDDDAPRSLAAGTLSC